MSQAVAAPASAAPEGCDERTVLRQRGQPEVFCGLTGIIWLHRKIQDACLAALVLTLPASDESQLLVVGALADVVEDQFARLFAAMGLTKVRFLPPRQAADMPPVGRATKYLLAQPFLADTARELEQRG